MIKEVRVKDQQLMCDMAHEVIKDGWLLSFFTVANIKKVIKENGLCFVGYYEDKLEGFIVYNRKNYQLGYIIVDKQNQYTGIGRSLIDWYLVECKKHKVKIIETNVFASKSFFDKCGFETKLEQNGLYMMTKIIKDDLLGETVNVIIEHPYGSFHSYYNEQYTLNTGFVKEIFDKDQEFVKAYVYGVKEPLESFKGKVCAIIHTADEEKIMIVSNTDKIDKDELINDIGFEMQHHDMYIEWL